MVQKDADCDFQVGYRKPPRHSRFTPGRSGNPRGKQKGARNLASDVKRILEVPVRLNEHGKARKVSTQEAALLRLREKALKGDARSLDRLLALAGIFNNVDEIGSPSSQTLAADDQAILDAYAQDVRARSAGADAVKPDGGSDDG